MRPELYYKVTDDHSRAEGNYDQKKITPTISSSIFHPTAPIQGLSPDSLKPNSMNLAGQPHRAAPPLVAPSRLAAPLGPAPRPPRQEAIRVQAWQRGGHGVIWRIVPQPVSPRSATRPTSQGAETRSLPYPLSSVS